MEMEEDETVVLVRNKRIQIVTKATDCKRDERANEMRIECEFIREKTGQDEDESNDEKRGWSILKEWAIQTEANQELEQGEKKGKE